MAKRSTLNISVTPAQARFIAARVRSGRYQSASEVVREAIRRLQDDEKRRKIELDEMRAKVAEGLAAAERGEFVTPEQFRATLDAHRTARTRKRAG
ncbi:MAG: type II toxin-antitoxin system ParD family antitoxin [Phycisphaerales bacterium]